MPWKSDSDVEEHKKGLSKSQKKKWREVANSILRECMADGGSEKSCAAKAIRIANSTVKGEVMKTQFQGSIKIIAENDPILDRILAENPVLKAVHQTANGKIAVMDAISIGQEGRPTVPQEVIAKVGEGPWVYDREVVQRALPTVFGKPVVIEASMEGHGDQTTRLTIGSIVGAEIYADSRGEFVRVFPVLWDSEYPEVIEEIKANKDGLSTSFEMEIATDKIIVQAGQVKPQDFAFSGSCILKRGNAAYPGQNIQAIAHSSEAVKEPSFYDLSRMVSSALSETKDGQDKYIIEMFPSNVVYSTFNDSKYWKSSYSVENGKVSLGDPIEVKPTYVRAHKDSSKTGDTGTHPPDVGTGNEDRQKNKFKSKGGMKKMFDNIPEEHREEAQKVLDAEVAKVKAEYEAKLTDETKKNEDNSTKIADLQAEVTATKKFEQIKASYPADKAGEILEVLKKIELKTATADEALKLSTLVVAEKKQDLVMGSGGNGAKKYSDGQLDSMFGIKAKKAS